MKNHQKNLAGIGEPMVPTFGGLANIDPCMAAKILFSFLLKSCFLPTNSHKAIFFRLSRRHR
jgi:hypothetical protein